MAAIFSGVNNYLQAVLFGGSMVVLLVGAGLFFTFKSRFFQIRGLPFILRNTVMTLLAKDVNPRKENTLSPFQAVTTALAGTMGVGNIAGVATALVAGGPGSIFWMWIGAFLGMMTKYAEIYLAVAYRRKGRDGQYYGGPMYYMEDGLGKKWLACLFALLCAVSSFGIGNLTQINSVSTAMESAFSLPPLICGIVAALLVALVVFGGVRRIGRVTELVIPFISILYLCFAGVILFRNRGQLPEALQLIVHSAVGLRPAAGGVAGFAVAQAVRLGLSRGVFTNEAGLGSAPIAHSAADCKSPAHQGVWGIFEVFLDTIVVCTITALVVLTAQEGALWQGGLDGAPLTSAAFEAAFGTLGSRFIALSIVFFGIAAMLGWCYYGESALRYLCRGKQGPVLLYRLLFVCCIVAGAVSSLELVWALSDSLNAMMAIPNVLALVALHRHLKTP